MCKKLVSICIALIMASACYAAESQVIGDWEGSMDGWSTAWTTNYSTTGATLPDSSLAIWPSAGWQDLFTDTAQAVGINYALLTTPGAYISLDLTWVSSEWESDGAEGDIWVKFDKMALQGDGLGWTEIDPTDTANPSYPGCWDPYFWGTQHTRTIEFYMPAAVQSLNPTNPSWFQIFFHSNYGTNGGAFLSTGAYYLDNMQVIVPEPATIALLGLGGLALIRRKK